MVAVRAILQARTTSSRLPGKVLMPVAGMPLAHLACRRAARQGLDVVVATSEMASDDVLAGALNAAGLTVVRGPLDDVHERFLLATRDLEDDAVVVRLTADNCFPDADFIGRLTGEFIGRGIGYLSAGTGADGLPYGMAAEVMRVGALRAFRPATAVEAEHVTVALRRAHPSPILSWDVPAQWSGLRCTIDTLEDYLRIAALLAEEPDPVGMPWVELCERLAAASPPSHARRRASDGPALVLGTVQLGLPYGIANRVGQPDAETGEAILQTAVGLGVETFDTARAYGTSEECIGRWRGKSGQTDVNVVTKLSPMPHLSSRDTAAHAADAVLASIASSCWALRMPRLDTVLLHRAAHLSAWGGEIMRRLEDLRDAGRIGRIGLSVDTPEELVQGLAHEAVMHVQFPLNILDHRWRNAEVADAVASRPDVTFHARSAYLQGLLLLRREEDWPVSIRSAFSAVAQALDATVRRLGRTSRQDLLIAYVRSVPWLDGVVVGAETTAQLQDSADLFALAPLTPGERADAEAAMPTLPERVLRPSLWT